MPAKARQKRAKLTDAERHARFVETATKVEASNDPKDFDRAFKRVISGPRPRETSKPKSR